MTWTTWSSGGCKKMLIIDSDAAIRERFADSQSTDSRQSSTARSPNERQSSGHGLPRGLNTGVGWIEVVRPGRSDASDASDADPAPTQAGSQAESITLPPPDGDLASARGIAFGAALGLIAWVLIGGLLGIFFA